MVFASLSFLLLFFPLSILVYLICPGIRSKNISLIVFSIIFYSWGEPVWVFLLLFTTMIDFQMAKKIEQYEDTPKGKVFLWISVCLSLGALVFFKYSSFLIENVNFVTGLTLKTPEVDLPIGISFYTFQSISYMVDVYNGKVKAQTSYSKYLLFISLFHQLVAGPIVRYSDIEKEINSRSVKWNDISNGTNRFIWGLFKKVFFANTAAVLVDHCLGGDIGQISIVQGLLGLTFFAIQLYYDFSGYSDMAIGMGKMIGFTYHENFNYPYASKSIKEFWSRWHISLGTFLKDYLFNPIAFKRKKWGKYALIYSLIITFFISGLWHGASWNFVFWGLYFAILIIIEEWFLTAFLQKIGSWAQHIYLILAIVFSYIFFYFVDFNQMTLFIVTLFQQETPWVNLELFDFLGSYSIWLIFSIFFLFPWGNRILNHFLTRWNVNQSWAQTTQIVLNFGMLYVSIAQLVAKSYNPFLYFRF
jgi:alginate O-acetyltransferase complex protein AlgI